MEIPRFRMKLAVDLRNTASVRRSDVSGTGQGRPINPTALDRGDFVMDDARKSPKTTDASDKRREYLRAYYRRNREKMLAYQRHYNAQYRKKLTDPSENHPASRRLSTPGEIMACPTEKAERMIEEILQGHRRLAM